jgi:hypothetical protein
VSVLLLLSLFVYMTFHFTATTPELDLLYPGFSQRSKNFLGYREFLNSQRLDENATALVIDPDELLGVLRTFMLSKAQWSVVIGEFFLLCFLPLKKPFHCIFFACSTPYSTFQMDESQCRWVYRLIMWLTFRG